MKEIFLHIWPILGRLRIFILISLGLLLVADVLGVYIPYLFGTLINDIQENKVGRNVNIAILAVVAMFASNLVNWLREYIDLKKYFFNFGEKIESYASGRLIKLSLGQHMGMNSGVVNETISMGIGALKDFIVSILFTLLPHIFYVVISLLAITMMSLNMGLLVATLSIIYMVIGVKFNKLYEARLLNLEAEQRKRGKMKSEILRNIVTVKLGGQEDWFMKEYNGEIVRVNNIARSLWLKYSFGSNALRLFPIVITASTLFLGIYLVKSGQETSGTFVMFFSWTTGIVSRLSSFRSELRQLARILPPIRKYLELVNQAPDLDESGTRDEVTFGGITFKNVSFHYGKKGENARGISNMTFEIQPGEMVGIVGESGAGKSTLTKLLLRGWDPESGGIYIDNIPLPDYTSSFRRQIVYIGQEGMPFDNTVRFNLTFGGDGDISDDVLWEKLQSAQLSDRIRQSEDGLDSVVGERGIRLSGGERQRLFMAQAMIRKAKILILDEATSHLDVNTEEIIFQRAIKEASRGVTTLIVAHRFATLKSCDRIMVLDNGRLISFDTHQTLMKTCSIYKELVSKQDLTLVN